MLAKNDPTEVLTVPKLVAWLQTKNPSTSFEYRNCRKCALAQYMQEHGFPDAHFGGTEYGIFDWDDSPYHIPRRIADAAHVRTFGEFLKNLA